MSLLQRAKSLHEDSPTGSVGSRSLDLSPRCSCFQLFLFHCPSPCYPSSTSSSANLGVPVYSLLFLVFGQLSPRPPFYLLSLFLFVGSLPLSFVSFNFRSFDFKDPSQKSTSKNACSVFVIVCVTFEASRPYSNTDGSVLTIKALFKNQIIILVVLFSVKSVTKNGPNIYLVQWRIIIVSLREGGRNSSGLPKLDKPQVQESAINPATNPSSISNQLVSGVLYF